MLVVVIALTLCPVRVYGETEFWFASLKVFMILGLLVLSVVLCFGGGPTHNRLAFSIGSILVLSKSIPCQVQLVGCAVLYMLHASRSSHSTSPHKYWLSRLVRCTIREKTFPKPPNAIFTNSLSFTFLVCSPLV